MAARTKPPFRADHVGSLLRPPALLKARADHAAGRIPDAALRRVEDEAIRDAVRMQEAVGLQAVTDGELRRKDWLVDFKYALGGVTQLGNIIKVPFTGADGNVEWEFVEYTVNERLRLDRPIFTEDFAFLESATKATPKITLPSPSMMHYPGGRGIDRAVYPDMEVFFQDIVRIFTEEIAALAALGCDYVQLDDTSLAFLNDPNRRAAAGDDDATIHLKYIEVFNAAVAKRPARMTICTHLCRGNFRSAWLASGDYEHVADAMFNRLDVDGFFLEYDDARSGGFEPLRLVPKGKMIVLGLVTTKSPVLESRDVLKRRIDAAAKFVPLDQLCLSPQCGFASTSEGNLLTVDDQVRKLALVVETAEEVWN